MASEITATKIVLAAAIVGIVSGVIQTFGQGVSSYIGYRQIELAEEQNKQNAKATEEARLDAAKQEKDREEALNLTLRQLNATLQQLKEQQRLGDIGGEHLAEAKKQTTTLEESLKGMHRLAGRVDLIEERQVQTRSRQELNERVDQIVRDMERDPAAAARIVDLAAQTLRRLIRDFDALPVRPESPLAPSPRMTLQRQIEQWARVLRRADSAGRHRSLIAEAEQRFPRTVPKG